MLPGTAEVPGGMGSTFGSAKSRTRAAGARSPIVARSSETATRSTRGSSARSRSAAATRSCCPRTGDRRSLGGLTCAVLQLRVNARARTGRAPHPVAAAPPSPLRRTAGPHDVSSVGAAISPRPSTTSLRPAGSPRANRRKSAACRRRAKCECDSSTSPVPAG